MGENVPKIAKNPVFSGFFVAQRRGFAPLAARPAPPLSTASFADDFLEE